MKGTHCGTRALALVVLLFCVSSAVPAVAGADVGGATVAPVAAALPAPALGAPAPPAATTVAVTPGSGTVEVAAPKAAAATKAVGAAQEKAFTTADKAATPGVTGVKQLGVKVTRIASGVVIRLVPAKAAKAVAKKVADRKQKAGRILAGNWGDDDWQSGCTKGGWTGCTQTPVGPIDNRCYMTDVGPRTSGTYTPPTGDPPPFSPTEQVMFTQGTQTMWTKTEEVYRSIAGVKTLVGVKVHMKTFIRGLYGTAPSGTIYKLGKDEADQWSVFFPLDGSLYVDKRTFSELVVLSGVAPSMWYSEHFVVKPGFIKITWRIVCNRGDKSDDDKDEGCDHDRSGDHDKYKHHREDWRGYNDDEPGSWDQDD